MKVNHPSSNVTDHVEGKYGKIVMGEVRQLKLQHLKYIFV